MVEDHKFLQQYRDTMDPYVEELGAALTDMGYTKEGLTDAMLVEAATRKLKTLHAMLLASGTNKDLLRAAMAE